MDAMINMADTLSHLHTPKEAEDGESKTARMRRELRENGPADARHLAEAVGTRSSFVGALMKHDIAKGRVRFYRGMYSWVYEREELPRSASGRMVEMIEWHEIANDDFPDADLTVIGRLRGHSEPAWLVYWNGEDWLDIDGQPVDVVRWSEMPKGGEV